VGGGGRYGFTLHIEQRDGKSGRRGNTLKIKCVPSRGQKKGQAQEKLKKEEKAKRGTGSRGGGSQTAVLQTLIMRGGGRHCGRACFPWFTLGFSLKEDP